MAGDGSKSDGMGNAIGGDVATSLSALSPHVAYTDLREWIAEANKLGEIREVKGLSWEKDIGMASATTNLLRDLGFALGPVIGSAIAFSVGAAAFAAPLAGILKGAGLPVDADVPAHARRHAHPRHRRARGGDRRILRSPVGVRQRVRRKVRCEAHRNLIAETSGGAGCEDRARVRDASPARPGSRTRRAARRRGR